MGERRSADGSAGDVDYGVIGRAYAVYRRADPRIAALIDRALGDARTVVNVGAGAGSYEPRDREVTAVEPSATMRAQRPAESPPAVDAIAEALPFADGSFDAAMATWTVHQWADLERGIAELRRVSRGPIVILAADPARLHHFWLSEYFPEVLDEESNRCPALDRLVAALGPGTRVEPVPIPLDCTDGFTEAYYGRPERLLDRGVQGAMSSWTRMPSALVRAFEARFQHDLASGRWDERYGAYRTMPSYDGSLRLVVRDRGVPIP